MKKIISQSRCTPKSPLLVLLSTNQTCQLLRKARRGRRDGKVLGTHQGPILLVDVVVRVTFVRPSVHSSSSDFYHRMTHISHPQSVLPPRTTFPRSAKSVQQSATMHYNVSAETGSRRNQSLFRGSFGEEGRRRRHVKCVVFSLRDHDDAAGDVRVDPNYSTRLSECQCELEECALIWFRGEICRACFFFQFGE